MTSSTAKTVLIIDDDEDFVESVRSILSTEGFQVVAASSGREGLQKVVEHEPDLILLDIMMETMTEGYGINEAIKFSEEYARFRDVPIIMVSSIQETPDERYPRALEVDMIRPDRYLTKPLNIPTFLATVKQATR